MRVGFTGPLSGMTDAQRFEVRALLGSTRARELHHGDRVGADEQAVAIASELGMWIVAHPPAERGRRAGCEYDEAWPIRSYAQCNEDIVLATDLLLSAPKGPETRRSRAWSTIRIACQAHPSRPHLIIWPDGSVSCGPRDTLGCYLIRDEAIQGLCELATTDRHRCA